MWIIEERFHFEANDNNQLLKYSNNFAFGL